MTIKLIVGLSNPGEKYIETRHNTGARYINFLVKKLHTSLHKEERFHGFTTYTNLENVNIHLFIPLTFMNLSGIAVKAIIEYYKINPEEILIAHDDLNLLSGRAKFKFGGSHGGHNGLKNIIKKLGNIQDFYRLRIGINRPNNNEVINFVLGKPSFTEQKHIDKAIYEAIYCTEIWLKEGFIKAINRLNSFKVK